MYACTDNELDQWRAEHRRPDRRTLKRPDHSRHRGGGRRRHKVRFNTLQLVQILLPLLYCRHHVQLFHDEYRPVSHFSHSSVLYCAFSKTYRPFPFHVSTPQNRGSDQFQQQNGVNLKISDDRDSLLWKMSSTLYPKLLQGAVKK